MGPGSATRHCVPHRVRGKRPPKIETAAPLSERGGSVMLEANDQLLRRPSAARFHCATLSAIMRVDFIAAWLSWA